MCTSTCYTDVNIRCVALVNQQLKRFARDEENFVLSPVFVVVAVSKRSIDPSRRPLYHFAKKKTETQRIEKKDKKSDSALEGQGDKEKKRGGAASQRKMDFRKVRAGLNSRKMSKRVEE